MANSENDGVAQAGANSGLLWLGLLIGVAVAFGAGLFVGEKTTPLEVSEVEQSPPLPPPPPEKSGVGTLLSGPSNAIPTTLVQAPFPVPAGTGETTYNGIILPAVWPPRSAYTPGAPPDVPYLRQPPEVIDISVGRQLFADDFLIESMTNLSRTYAIAEQHSGNPVLVPDHDVERSASAQVARPLGDGVWWDPTNYHFKMWYRAGAKGATALAISTNGTNWAKPALHGPGSSSVVQPDPSRSANVVLDTHTTNELERCKLFRSETRNGVTGLALHLSSGGTNWGKAVRWFAPAPDGSSVFYNPFRKVWVFALVSGDDRGSRRYWEMRDLMKDPIWPSLEAAPMWTGMDSYDLPDEGFGLPPRLASLEVTPYESLLVGVFGVWKGDYADGRGSRTELQLGYSRDGFHWLRPDRRAFIAPEDEPMAWSSGGLSGVGGGFNIVGRQLNFLYGAEGRTANGTPVGAAGMATIRRDGFAAITAGPEEGMLVTKPVLFKYAGYMLINLQTNAPDGEVRVAIVSTNGNQLEVTNHENNTTAAFSSTNCVPVRGDQTLTSVNWNNIQHIGMLMNRPVRFVFYIKNASLYSFWISRSRRGRSEGFSAGGGMHYGGPSDDIGNRSYRGPDYVPSWLRPKTETNLTNSASAPAGAVIGPSNQPEDDSDQ